MLFKYLVFCRMDELDTHDEAIYAQRQLLLLWGEGEELHVYSMLMFVVLGSG